jgi:hypothetical protein
MEKIKEPTVVVLESDYRERFVAARGSNSWSFI